MIRLVLAATLGLMASSFTQAWAANCDELKGAMAARLTDACERPSELTKQEIEDFKSGIERLLNECRADDFAESLYHGVLFKTMGLAQPCKAHAKVLSHVSRLNEA